MRVRPTVEHIRAAFELVKDDPAFAESAQIVASGGAPMELLQALSLRPELLRAFSGFSACVYPGGLLERAVKEFVIIEASRANACQFCRDSHIAVARMLGIDDDPLERLADPTRLSQREALAVEYTRAAMADSNRVPDALFQRLRSAFTEPEIVELTFLIGYINCLNLFNNCLRVTYHGEMDRAPA